MKKFKLMYYAANLYLMGIYMAAIIHILNYLTKSHSLYSKTVVKLSEKIQMLQKSFSRSEKRFISLYVQLSCQQ